MFRFINRENDLRVDAGGFDNSGQQEPPFLWVSDQNSSSRLQPIFRADDVYYLGRCCRVAYNNDNLVKEAEYADVGYGLAQCL